jgi:diamine N-acetyltransferase
MTEPVLRPAKPGDADRLLPLIAAYYAHDGLRFEAAPMREGLVTFLADPALGRAFFLELAGELAGYALVSFGFDLEFGGRFCLLTDFYLVPERRRQGHGLATLRLLERECCALGARSLLLEVERKNAAAQALYRRAGFRAIDRIPMAKTLGE